MFCGSYGGFGYSKRFQEWVKTHENVDTSALAVAFGLKNAAEKYCLLRLIFVPRYATCSFSEYDGLETPVMKFCDYDKYALDLLLLARGEKRIGDLSTELQAIITSPLTPQECEFSARSDIEHAKPVMKQLYELSAKI